MNCAGTPYLSATRSKTGLARSPIFDIKGTTHWEPPTDVAPGYQPITADWQFGWLADPNILTIDQGSFATLQLSATITGTLQPRRSNLNLKLDTDALEANREFINKIQGAAPVPRTPQGPYRARFIGTVKSPVLSAVPRFKGICAANASSTTPLRSTLSKAMSRIPPKASLLKTRARIVARWTSRSPPRWNSPDWSFRPENTWSVDASVEKSPADAVQQLLQVSYPVTGVLSGQFHARGTRAQPSVTGLFDLANANAYGFAFDSLRGQ